MELIKPFLKYSKLYRNISDEAVRQLIYSTWCSQQQQQEKISSVLMCMYCHANVRTDDKRQYCDQCLFPLYADDDEVALYCLLSICFYESSTCNADSHRIVYRQRIKMTWYEHESHDKVYIVCHAKCLQCRQKIQNVGARYTYFDERMFCKNCMFPLFNVTFLSQNKSS